MTKLLHTDEQVIDYLHHPSTVIHGVGAPKRDAAAAAAGRAFLVKEFGGEAALEQQLRRGRPRLGESERRGPSHEIRGRVTDSQFKAIESIRSQTGQSTSEIIREMADNWIASQRLSA